MTDQELLGYINNKKKEGVSDQVIRSELINFGWDQNRLNEAFQLINNIPTLANAKSLVTDKDYPIQNKLILKYAVSFFPIIIFVLFLNSRLDNAVYSIIMYLPVVFFIIVVVYLKKITFHYELQSNHLVLSQGIISKQHRTLQYGVIQNVLVKQSLFDRLFNISTLIIENAAGAGSNGLTKVFGIKVKNKKQETDIIGFKGNKVSIPGLDENHAETLKGLILQKIRDNPIEDKQSGL